MGRICFRDDEIAVLGVRLWVSFEHEALHVTAPLRYSHRVKQIAASGFGHWIH